MFENFGTYRTWWGYNLWSYSTLLRRNKVYFVGWLAPSNLYIVAININYSRFLTLWTCEKYSIVWYAATSTICHVIAYPTSALAKKEQSLLCTAQQCCAVALPRTENRDLPPFLVQNITFATFHRLGGGDKEDKVVKAARRFLLTFAHCSNSLYLFNIFWTGLV